MNPAQVALLVYGCVIALLLGLHHNITGGGPKAA